MKADKQTISDFLSENKTQFVIPIYQRNYDWRVEHCKQLLSDIMRAGRNRAQTAHFIGSIVYAGEPPRLNALKEFTVIDGQQRITTITLIYIAMRRLADETGDAALRDEITDTYLINKYADENARLKLRPTDNNAAVLKELLHGDGAPDGSSNIAENFNYFRKTITIDNLQTVRDGLQKLTVVGISLDRDDDPQLIFESMNSTGLDLSQADLIRNHILMGLGHAEQKRLYEDFWLPIEKSCQERGSNESKVSDFMRDTLTAANKRIPNKAKVYQEFKAAWPRADANGWAARLAALKKSAAHYGKILNPDGEPDAEIRARLLHVKRMDVSVAHPFLLRAYADYADGTAGAAAFAGVLDAVMSFVMRRMVCELPSSALNKIFMLLRDKIDTADYLPSLQRALAAGSGKFRFPDDNEVRAALHSKNVYEMKGGGREHILERLENHQNRERVQIDGNPDITIEHIFPQNPAAEWKRDLCGGDYQRLRGELLHTLGNLTLSGNNGALGNKPFAAKRDMPEKGYAGSRLWLNRRLAALEKWDAGEWEKRTAALAERFMEIWPHPPPEALARGADGRGAAPVSEIGDITGMEFKYAVFLGEKITTSSFTACYAEIIRKMFGFSPEKFIGTELGAFLKITPCKPEKLIAAKIGDSWFACTNYSHMEKMRRLARACEELDLEGALSLKFTARASAPGCEGSAS